MKSEDYPAVSRSASMSSNDAQRQYLIQIGSQYVFLFLAAVASLEFNNFPSSLLLYSLFLIASTVMLVVTATIKPEKDWYASRALAESLKTTTWRYMMNAHPFDRTDTPLEARAEFADRLSEIIKANEHAQKAMKRRSVAGVQITDTMRSIRMSSLYERIEYYVEHRIKFQRDWYIVKANSNRKWFRNFILCSVIVQSGAIILSLLRLRDYNTIDVWPTEPLLVLASALVGWIQIKKFNELASSYSLTAHEIGMIEAKVSKDVQESDWSDFVNEAELAFSREHTQWVARQDLTN
jgi:hypothetical protein